MPANNENINQQNEEELEFFSITDENDEEQDFALIAEFETGGKTYWICQEANFKDDNKVELNEDAYVAFRVERDEEGNAYLDSLDDEEFNHLKKEWQRYVENLEKEDVEDVNE
ncbi:MAG: DUF1292 domain-containing protein [Thermotogota bacterium]|nr:DUF1292 domain-containing protein [Thermotogota bacterium]